MDRGFGVGIEGHVVAGRAAVHRDPSAAAFHDPASFDDAEAADLRVSVDDFDVNSQARAMLDDGGQTFAGARPTAGRPSLSRPMEARRLCCPSMCQHQVPSATAEAFCPPALRLSARRRLSQQRRLVSQLAVENSGLSSGNKGAWNMRLRVGMGGDRVADGLVQGADGCPDAPHELDLDPDELFNNGLAEAGSRPGRGAHALDHDAARALSGVALPLAPAFQPPGGELGGRGRGGVPLQECQGDVAA